jgi:uncharacterized protein YdhG (YjbR/CyaY superfamily)
VGDNMQYDVSTSEEYLEILEEDWRKEKLLEIREIILTYAPELEETIRYKMLNFGKDDRDDYIFALNAQKHYVSLYVGSISKIDPNGEMLEDFNLGKGCIRVRKTVNLANTNLEAFIQETIDLWRLGEDVYC